MLLVVVGTILLLLKLLDIEPVAAWSWWWILSPFAGAVLWWAYADSTGLTQRRAIKRMEERKVQRRERDIEALGLGISSHRRKKATRSAVEEARARSQERQGGDGKGG